MGNRYWISGAQIGAIIGLAREHGSPQTELALDKIMEEQHIGVDPNGEMTRAVLIPKNELSTLRITLAAVLDHLKTLRNGSEELLDPLDDKYIDSETIQKILDTLPKE